MSSKGVSLAASAALAEAGEIYTVDPTHSEVSFQVRHLLTQVRGRFTEFEGTIDFRPDDVEASSVEFSVRAESIDTDLAERDQHLRSEDFFWVDKHPEIRFRSTRVERLEPDRFLVTGDLRLRGVTREVQLAVEYLGQMVDPWGNGKAGFATATTLDRKDFGMVWNMALDQGGVILGDQVTIGINLETLAQRREVQRREVPKAGGATLFVAGAKAGGLTMVARRTAGALLLAVSLPGIALGAAAETPTFDTTRVADGVYTFRWNAHRNMFVVTDQGVIVTDPLNPAAAQALLAEIRKVTARPVRYVVYSHQHWDHVLGGAVFKEAGATFISHERCLAHFERRPHPDLVPPDLTFDGPGFDLELGGRKLELRYFGPNHGDCLIAMRLADERILFLVDLASPQAVGFRILPDYQPLELIRSLEEIEHRLEFDRVIPGHLAAVAPPGMVAEARGFYEDLMAAVGEAWQAGVRDPAELVRQVRLPRYESWLGYDEWLPLNVERAWAYYHMGW